MKRSSFLKHNIFKSSFWEWHIAFRAVRPIGPVPSNTYFFITTYTPLVGI